MQTRSTAAFKDAEDEWSNEERAYRGIDFDEERTLLKCNSNHIPMTKAATVGNVIHMQQLVGGLLSRY